LKPASFDYHRVDSVEEALERLADLGEDAKVLAGGQSLVPMMNFRLVRPPSLVDIGPIPDLKYVFRDGDALRIGALTLHREVEQLDVPEIVAGFEVLSDAARFVGHYPIRTRGTFGGSIAHADPAAEWCMLAVLLDAEVVVVGPAGERVIPAGDFFLSFFTTTLEPGELVIEVRFPRPTPHAALSEFARRHGDFAIVAAAVALKLDGDSCQEARVVVGGVDEVPLRVPAAEEILTGSELDADALAAAGREAAEAIDPPADIHGPSEYRRDLADVLIRRAVAEALERGRGESRDGEDGG
jgi:aerobic carbon-monoxide dehydrogenase medium subunit